MKQFFDKGAAAFGRQSAAGRAPDARQRRLGVLQKQLDAREFRESEQQWMISLTQGQFSSEEVRQTIGDTLSRDDTGSLLACICNEQLKYRNRAVAVLSYHRHIRVGHIASFLGVSHSSVDNWIRRFAQHGCHLLLPFASEYRKAKDQIYRDAVFEILTRPAISTRDQQDNVETARYSFSYGEAGAADSTAEHPQDHQRRRLSLPQGQERFA